MHVYVSGHHSKTLVSCLPRQHFGQLTQKRAYDEQKMLHTHMTPNVYPVFKRIERKCYRSDEKRRLWRLTSYRSPAQWLHHVFVIPAPVFRSEHLLRSNLSWSVHGLRFVYIYRATQNYTFIISSAVNSKETVPHPTVGVGWSVMVTRRNRTVELSNSVATQTHTAYALHVFKETRTLSQDAETAQAQCAHSLPALHKTHSLMFKRKIT